MKKYVFLSSVFVCPKKKVNQALVSYNNSLEKNENFPMIFSQWRCFIQRDILEC